MISQELYEKFFNTYNPSYNGYILRPFSWCFSPRDQDNGYTEFINRRARPGIDISIDAKYDSINKIIDIRCYYEYDGHFYEKGQVMFKLCDLKKNTYECKTTDDKMVNYMADQEIMTFIKQFDDYILELQDNPILYHEYVKYMIHITNKCPELLHNHKSSVCTYNVSIFPGGGGLVVKFDYYYYPGKVGGSKEFMLFNNRELGDDFYDIEPDLYEEIIKRYDMIVCDFRTFNIFIMFHKPDCNNQFLIYNEH